MNTTLKIVLQEWDRLSSMIDDMEKVLEELKEQKKNIENSVLPSEMAGFPSMTTEEGFSITLEKFVNPKIEEGQEITAFDWISGQGYGSLIKHRLDFDKDQSLDGVKDFLQKEGLGYKEDMSIHYQSLRKMAKEILEDAQSKSGDITVADVFPPSLKVEVFTKANIKRIKK